MKYCRRCHQEQMQRVRETVARHGRYQYAVVWYRCPSCQDAGLTFRRLDVAQQAEQEKIAALV